MRDFPADHSDWLIQTKLHPPRLRADLAPRPMLLKTLSNAVAGSQLTLLAAPAGYGKTALVAAWAASQQESQGGAGAPHMRVAWLALDEGDNDVARFIGALVTTLRQIEPAIGGAIPALLNDMSNPTEQIRRIVTLLINSLLGAAKEPLVLALDDLHAITEPLVYMALDMLIERAPQQLHLLVTTRYDPPLALARLRARGQLTELRLRDLRFTAAETGSFLNEHLQLGLAEDELALLQERTEGWPAGLRLLASPLDATTIASRAALLKQLARRERFVFDFLADEVLRQQEPDVLSFLLDTAILTELTSTLCAAVTGQPKAAYLLEQLAQRNLFLEAVADLPDTYRYHALFADFLRQRLQRDAPERVTELHARAAAAETNPAHAIDHFIAARLWEQASERIEQIGAVALARGWLDTVRGWIKALPEEVCARRPLLVYLLARSLWRQDTMGQAVVLMRQAADQLAQAVDKKPEAGVALAYLANAALLRGDTRSAEDLIAAAMSYPLPPQRLVQMWFDLNYIHGVGADYKRAMLDLDAGFRVVEEHDTLEALAEALKVNPMPLRLLPGVGSRLDRLRQRAQAHNPGGDDPLQISINIQLAVAKLWQGKLHESAAAADQALALEHRLSGDPRQLHYLTMLRIQTALALNDTATAATYRDLLLDRIDYLRIDGRALQMPLYFCARAYQQEGDLVAAQAVCSRMLAADQTDTVPGVSPWLLLVQGVLASVTGQWDDAAPLLQQAEEEQQRQPLTLVGCSVWVYVAWHYLLTGRREEALALLRPMLLRYRAENSIGMLLRERLAAAPLLQAAVSHGVEAEYAAHLLTLLGENAVVTPPPAAALGGASVLSARELEIIGLIANGAGNAEIAERLIISENTLKTHIRRIFQKLEVTTRTQAVARARQRNLI